MLKTVLTISTLFVTMFGFSQVRLHANFGVSTATGDFGSDSNLGIGYAFNARYMFNEKLDAGIEYDASAIVTVGDGFGDVDATGMTGYLVKGYYSFMDKKFTPYGAIATGLYQVETPEISVVNDDGSEEVIVPAEKKINFGFSPELGLRIGGFVLATKFSYAGKHPVNDDVNVTYMRYFIGYTYSF